MISFNNFISYLDTIIIRIAYQIYIFIEAINRIYLYYIFYEIGLVFKYIIINYFYSK